MDYGAEFGAPVIIGLPRRPAARRRLEARSARLVASMGACADHAASLGEGLVVEPINRYETPVLNTADDTLAVVDQIGAANVKLLLDAFHMNIEEVSIGDAIRRPGDAARPLPRGRQQPPGRRHGPRRLPRDRRRAADIGYHGWLSAEVLPLPDDFSAARQARQFCLGLTQYLI